ncbi:hypothetical protein BKA62DRAFT_776245 [Auriculariales sp. MPI-PUGE-AT-0066]|nr:hypothetical protein BKA62DRAFT_776245 [Auriculariales sp. MPI-PUGE-AT-0066]
MPPNLPQGQKGEPEADIDRFLSECADSAPGPRNEQSASSALLETSHGRRSRYDQLLTRFSRGLATIEDVPDEVLAKIMHLVDHQDLLNAVQVSHRWNCVAATASLWAVVDLDQLRTWNPADLNARLRKSQRSPLTILSSLINIVPHRVIRDICSAHMDHILDLQLLTDGWNSELDQLMFGQPAPLLETLVCIPSSDTMQLPANLWPGANCKVESLGLGVFSLSETPNPRPITTLHHFGGFMDGDVSYARNLFAYFPNLIDLHLTLVSADSVVNLPSSFPNGLQELKLTCIDRRMDWANILAHLPPSLQKLSIEPVHDIIPCLALMKRILFNENWSLFVLSEDSDTETLIQLRSELGRNFEFVFVHEDNSNQKWFATPDFFKPENLGHNLVRLEIPYSNFELMRKQASEIGSLNYLHVHHIPAYDTGLGCWHEIKAQQAIRVPRLESITFEVNRCAESDQAVRWFSHMLPQQLRNLVQFDAERLHTVVLVCYKVRKIISSFSSCCLGRVSRNVVIRQNLTCESRHGCLDNSEVATPEELSCVKALRFHSHLSIDEHGQEFQEYSITPGTCLCDTDQYVQNLHLHI